MSDVSWTIVTDPDGNVTAKHLTGNPPTVTRGRTIRVVVDFTEANYVTVRDYLDFAGAASTFVALDGTAYYREHSTASETLVLGFNPSGADLDSNILGWWGLLMGGEDQTPPVFTGHRLMLETFVLAEYSEYASISAVSTALEKT